ncbi:MAG: hypothetical protein ABIM89_01735 [Mycobacteriales bacterium]
MPPPVRREPSALVQGVESLAGEILYRSSAANLDPRIRTAVEKQLSGVLPGRLIQPGQVVEPRRVGPDDLVRLLRAAAVTAGGLDPARTPDPPPPLLWVEGANRLLVRIADLGVVLDDGLIELAIPVFCDEIGESQVTVGFVTESPERPTGGLCVTEDRPRGPAVVVDTWHEPIIALAWHTLLIATGALSGVAGADVSGQSLVTSTVSVARDGLTVAPMARHSFVHSAPRS